MVTATGSPDASVVIYAIQRGEYDRDLARLVMAIQQRRDTFDRVGAVKPSLGDTVEIWDEPNPSRDVKVPSIIIGAKLRVVGFRTDGLLRCTLGDRVVKIDPDWVYRVHYAP